MLKVMFFLKHPIDDLFAAKRPIGECAIECQRAARASALEVPEQLRGLERCVVSSTLLSGYRAGSPLYDAVIELWFTDESDARAVRHELTHDALSNPRAVDRKSFCSILTCEHVAKEGPVPSGGVKSIEFVTRQPGMPLEAFQAYWRQVHGPLAARIPMIRRYVQSHCIRSEYDDGDRPAWDGVAITWFDDTQQMRESAGTTELAETRADEPNFLAPGHLPFIITTEETLVSGPTDG